MPLVISLCKQAVRHVPRFTDEELTIVLGALMHFGHSDHYFVEAMEKYVPSVAFTSHPETVTKVSQFFGRRNILSPTVFDAVAESFVYRADDYSTSQVARQIMALGKLGYLPPNAGEVFRKVESILHSRFSHFQPRTLLNLLHSCTLVERFPVNFVSKVFSSYFLQQLQGKTSCSVYNLYMNASLLFLCWSFLYFVPPGTAPEVSLIIFYCFCEVFALELNLCCVILSYWSIVDYKTNDIVCVSEQGTGMDRIVLAQLTQLYMTLKLECPFYEVKYEKHVSV